MKERGSGNESSSPDWRAAPPEERNARLASELRESAAKLDPLVTLSRSTQDEILRFRERYDERDEDAPPPAIIVTTVPAEVIVTDDLVVARRFTAEVDAACVFVNASTRFTDGGQFGLGAEMGISTQKLHVRGPIALDELTCVKYVLWGDGQVRE